MVSARGESAWIRSRRPPKNPVDPWSPIGVVQEEEFAGSGRDDPVVTIFLAGSECPLTCVFCDLWRFTLDEPTPLGAIPRQIEKALAELDSRAGGGTVKLYNASNFFDPRAVPVDDWETIANLLGDFDRITVECHPRWIDRRLAEFALLLDGRLEIAIGLETIHPVASTRLNKMMTLDDFDRAAAMVCGEGFDLRVFVLVGAPWVPPEQTVEWTVRTARYGFERGARIVSLIPVRTGNGALDRLVGEGDLALPHLGDLELAAEQSVELDLGIVQVDLWEIERLTACAACFETRVSRLETLNRRGLLSPRINCPDCGQLPGV